MKNLAKKMKKEQRAITLISLVITIVILLILATIGIGAGIETINSSKLTKFNTEMKIMQLKANEWYDEYNSAKSDEEKQEIINRGESIVSGEGQSEVVKQANKVFSLEESGIVFNDTDQIREDYRYYSNQKLKNLGVDGVEQDFFVNIKNRTVVSYEGLSYKGEMYYTISQLPQMDIYNVDYEENSGTPTFKVKTSEVESNRKWKIEVYDIQYEGGYINKWDVKYRIQGQEDWKTSTNLNFEVTEPGIYEVRIENNEIQSSEQNVEIKANEVKVGEDFTDSNGNEWVWIEVPQSIYTDTNYNDNGSRKPEHSEDYDNIEYVMQQYASEYRNNDDMTAASGDVGDDEWYEGCGLEPTEYEQLKKKMLKSVYENEGFYIGKYEVGIKEENIFRSYDTDYNTEHPINGTPVIQANKVVYNWITISQAQELSKRLEEGLNLGNKEISLMFGIQWDLVLKYIETKNPTFGDSNQTIQYKLKIDSMSWGNYMNATYKITNVDAKYSENYGKEYKQISSEGYQKSTSRVLFTTGATQRNSVLEIYDLAGNVNEMTLEKTVNNAQPCSSRGGIYYNLGTNNPVAFRGMENTSYNSHYLGFRATLY